MNFDEIRQMPTLIDRDNNTGSKGWHESVTRSYQILQRVKGLLQDGVVTYTILELIIMMETPLPTTPEPDSSRQ